MMNRQHAQHLANRVASDGWQTVETVASRDGYVVHAWEGKRRGAPEAVFDSPFEYYYTQAKHASILRAIKRIRRNLWEN